MTLNELREKVLARLAENLAPLGYRYRPRSRSFVLDGDAYQRMYHISFIHHGGVDSDITADVAIRHHAVEQRMNARRSHLSKREATETATVGAELGNLAGTGQHRWTLANDHDVEPIVAGLLDHFERVGLPFLERFSSLSETLQALDADDRFARLICPLERTETRDALRELLGGAV